MYTVQYSLIASHRPPHALYATSDRTSATARNQFLKSAVSSVCVTNIRPVGESVPPPPNEFFVISVILLTLSRRVAVPLACECALLYAPNPRSQGCVFLNFLRFYTF